MENPPKQLKMAEWIDQNQLKTNKGKPIEFRDHRFLWDFLHDEAKRIVVQKCTQIGITFSALLKILKLGDQYNISVVYTLPTSGDVKDLVVSKFDPIIENSIKLSEKVEKDPFSRRAVFSTVLKRIGGSHYFFRGSWTETKAQTIDADILVVDELDFQKPGIRKMYEERLSGSGSKNIIYWLGVPSLPNYGISELYQKSDQREWNIQCPKCKKVQTLEFPVNISFNKKTFICRFCRVDLSDDDRRNGRWIPKYPGREIHGYYFNRLMAPWISAEKIIKSYHTDKPKHFHNFSLGMPYLEKTQQLSKEEFHKAKMYESEYQDFNKERLVCGIDQGNNFNLIAGHANSQESVATRVQMLTKTEDLEDALESLNPDLIVMDMYPDQHYAKKLQKRFGASKFLLINQRTWGDFSRLENPVDFQRNKGLINLERTEALDQMMDSIRNSSLRFLALVAGLEDLLAHLRNLVPDFQERYGRRKKVYKSIGRDDYAHALNYFFVGCGILFPDIGLAPSRIVPSAVISEPQPGTPKWMEQDFEKKVREISGSGGIIHIPIKKL